MCGSCSSVDASVVEAPVVSAGDTNFDRETVSPDFQELLSIANGHVPPVLLVSLSLSLSLARWTLDVRLCVCVCVTLS